MVGSRQNKRGPRAKMPVLLAGPGSHAGLLLTAMDAGAREMLDRAPGAYR